MGDGNDGTKRGRPRKVTNTELIREIRRIDKERFIPNDALEVSELSSLSRMTDRLNELTEFGVLKKHDLERLNQYSLRITTGDIIGALDEIDQNASIEEVADVLGCDQRAARLWLQALEAEEILTSKPIGDGQRVWSVRAPDT